MTVGYGSSTTSFTAANNSVDLTGHSVDLSLSTLSIGGRTNTGNGATTTAVFKYDTGTVTATSVTVGDRRGNSTTVNGPVSGDLQIGGGTTTIGAGGLTIGTNTATAGLAANTVAGSVSIGGNAAVTVGATGNVSVTLGVAATTGAISTATLSITGTSSLTVAGDIIKGTGNGSGTVTSTLTLNGGTLDMGGFAIGSGGLGAGLALNAVNLQSGTLRNVNQINGGATALSKTTGGTLLLNGANTFTNTLSVDAGTLGGSGSTAGAITVSSGAAVRGGSAGVGVAAPNGTLTVNANVTVNGGAALRAEVASDGAGGATASLLALGGTGTLNLGSGGTFSIDLVNNAANGVFAGVPGSTYTIVLATAPTIQVGGNTITSGTIDTGAYTLTSSNGSFAGFADNGTLTVSTAMGVSTLQLAFTPTPEPATVLGLAAGGLGLVNLVRRRRAAKAGV